VLTASRESAETSYSVSAGEINHDGYAVLVLAPLGQEYTR
jgi:hypothetical protein